MRYANIGFIPTADEMFYGTIILVSCLLIGYFLRVGKAYRDKFKK